MPVAKEARCRYTVQQSGPYACMKRKAAEALAAPELDGCSTPLRAAPKRRRVRVVAVVQTLLTRYFGFLPRPAAPVRA